MALLLVFSLFFFGFRAQALIPADPGKIWGISKESAIAISIFLNLVFAVIVWIGTMFPILTEALTKQRISIQAPYFNTFAPYVGFAAVLVMGVGNLMHYVRSPSREAWLSMLFSLFVALPLTYLFYEAGSLADTSSQKAWWMQVVGSYLCFWTLSCLTIEVILRFKIQKFKLGGMFEFQKAFLGAYIVHLGVLIGILGFLGNYRGLVQEKNLRVGDRYSFQGYELSFNRGIQTKQDGNATLFFAPISLKPSSQVSRDSIYLEPGRAKFPTSNDLTHEVSFYSTFWHDIYLVLADFDRSTGDQITLKIYYNPTVRLVWWAAALAALGGLLALLDPLRGRRSRDQVYSEIRGNP